MLQKDVQDRLIREGRDFMKGNRLTDPYRPGPPPPPAAPLQGPDAGGRGAGEAADGF